MTVLQRVAVVGLVAVFSLGFAGVSAAQERPPVSLPPPIPVVY